MRKNSLAGAAIVAATFTVIAITGPVSQGAPKAKAKPDCPDKAICLWDEENYQGQRVVVKTKELSNKILNKMNDLASSAFMSRKKGVAVLYTDADGGGEAVCLYEENRWRINKFGAPFDESISSTDFRKGIPASCVL